MENDLEGTTVYLISGQERLTGELAERLETRGLTVSTFASVDEALAKDPPHVLVVDVEGGGLGLLRRARERFHAARALVISGGEDEIVLAAFSGGVHGFVANWEPVAAIEAAVIMIARGGAALSLPALQALLRSRVDTAGSERSLALAAERGLTARQVEVLQLVARGYTDAEIAEVLTLSARTVEHHVADVLRKLDCGRRREAAALIFGQVPPGVRQAV